MCSFVSQQNATDGASIEGASIWRLTAGMSTRSVARPLNVHFSTIAISKGVSENVPVHLTSLTTADHV